MVDFFLGFTFRLLFVAFVCYPATVLSAQEVSGAFYDEASLSAHLNIDLSNEISQIDRGHEGVRVLCRVDDGIALLSEDSLKHQEVAKPPTQKMNRAPVITAWRQIDLVAVAPGEFSGLRSDDEIITQILQSVQAANRYLRTLRLRIHLVGVQIFRDGFVDPYAKAAQSGDAFAALDTLQDEWDGRNYPEHSLRVVFAGTNFHNTFGLAYTASSCIAPSYSVLFVSQGGDFPGAKLSLASTLAHEIGHYVGMTHDGLDPNSLMWPFFKTNSNGFSSFSVAQYERHAAVGSPGGECFSEIPSPVGEDGENHNDIDISSDEELVFEGGGEQVVSVLEGSTFVYQARIQGAENLPGLSYEASFLPKGALFNSHNGSIHYVPDFQVSSSSRPNTEFLVSILAKTIHATAQMSLLIQVRNVNHSPDIKVSEAGDLVVEEGSRLGLTFQARDPDVGDRIRSFALENISILKSMPGASLDMSGNQAVLDWKVPFVSPARYRLIFKAIDSLRQMRRKAFIISVIPRNIAPVVELKKDTLISNSSDRIHFSLRTVDPESEKLRFDVSRIPEGSIISYKVNQIDITIPSNTNLLNENKLFVLHATDGVKTTSVELDIPTLLSDSTKSTSPLGWPGSLDVVRNSVGAERSDEGNFRIYNTDTGIWRQFDCSGKLQNKTQFGGLLGDSPIVFRDNLSSYRAIYRNGSWLIDTENETQTLAFGLEGDVPLVADFDGDSISDPTVFRPGDGWYISFSSMPAQVLRDIDELIPESSAILFPMNGDVDGDGYEDRIIFVRRASGQAVFYVWLANGMRQAFVVRVIDLATKIVPIVADLDGDGKSDLGVMQSDGEISVLFSKDAALRKFFANVSGTDLVTTTDCDGDGVSELVLFDRASEQTFVMNLASGLENTFALAIESADVTSETFLRRRSYLKSVATFGDFNGNGLTNLALWRADYSFAKGRMYETDIGVDGEPPRSSVFGVEKFGPELDVGFGFVTAGNFKSANRSLPTIYSDGHWVTFSGENSVSEQMWGISGDIPVAGDYNGDGLTDYAIFRPGDSSWYIMLQNAKVRAVKVVYWGERGDIPVAADYNGDSVTDVAVWRPSTGEWFVLFEDSTVDVFSWGEVGDIPVPADYTGDGVAEVAIWRPQTGSWHIRTSSGPLHISWGLDGDKPVLGDYNGDGRSDLAIWRPNSGIWAVLSLNSFGHSAKVKQFGLSEDIPLGSWSLLRTF